MIIYQKMCRAREKKLLSKYLWEAFGSEQKVFPLAVRNIRAASKLQRSNGFVFYFREVWFFGRVCVLWYKQFSCAF